MGPERALVGAGGVCVCECVCACKCVYTYLECIKVFAGGPFDGLPGPASGMILSGYVKHHKAGCPSGEALRWRSSRLPAIMQPRVDCEHLSLWEGATRESE
uniref:Uncharacterized protein n=1 Tax=Dunaliella tertiolecta TaxID=3047 RepID=A0A7S3VKV4_DUNTE